MRESADSGAGVIAGDALDGALPSGPPGNQAVPPVPPVSGADAGAIAMPSPDVSVTTPPGLPAVCASSQLPPGRSSFQLDVGGQTRTFRVYAPSDYKGERLPLVFDFHALRVDLDSQEAMSNWDDRVDSFRYLVAMPLSLDGAWNLGPCCTQSRSVDDVAFVRAIVAKISQAACVDPKRIYATGSEIGGGMAYELACEAADLFAAVAPVGFDLLVEMECDPARPISVFSYRGTADAFVPYAGGRSTTLSLSYGVPPVTFLGAVKTLERWAQLDGCTSAPVQQGQAGCQSYTQCQKGVEVSLCTDNSVGATSSDADLIWPLLKGQLSP